MYNNKRIRKPIPSYKKIFSVYQYDEIKYHKLYKNLQQIALKLNDVSIFNRVNPYRILDLCYIRDCNGKRIKTCNVKHIFRLKVKHHICGQIASELISMYDLALNDDVLRYIYKRTGIAFFVREDLLQAELLEVRNNVITPIEWVRVHIDILRQLRQHKEVEVSVKIAKELNIDVFNKLMKDFINRKYQRIFRGLSIDDIKLMPAKEDIIFCDNIAYKQK